MKRMGIFALLLCVLLCGCGGNNRDMNWVIDHEPAVRGIVKEIGLETVCIQVTESDDPAFPPGDEVYAERATRLNDCKFYMEVGDEVAVYYDGEVKPEGVVQIPNVHGYLLITPVNRETGEE